ncbi:hypothetical protein QEN19_004120 [Hanseniaspora menglaensis]
MAEIKYEFFVLGSTGICGGAFVKYLSKHIETTSKDSVLKTIVRKSYSEAFLKANELGRGETVTTYVEKDSSKWASHTFTENVSKEASTKIFFSGLGTTRADAGSLEAQKKIDVDLNYAVAKAAKEQGFTTYVLVSSAGANSKSWSGYLKLKGDLENKIRDLNFENLIILRPGVLLGDRLGKHKGFGNSAAAYLGGLVYGTFLSKYIGSPIYADEVGKAGVLLALKAASENAPTGMNVYTSETLLKIANQ